MGASEVSSLPSTLSVTEEAMGAHEKILDAEYRDQESSL